MQVSANPTTNFRDKGLAMSAHHVPISGTAASVDQVDATYSKISWRLLPFSGRAAGAGLAGPRQHRLRQAADARRPEIQRSRLRPGRRHLLHRLLPVRSALQHVAAEDRRQEDGDAHHHRLGPDLHLAGLGDDTDPVLHPALDGRVRGRLLPRHHPLPDLLVSVRCCAKGLRHLHVGLSHRRRSSAARWLAAS